MILKLQFEICLDIGHDFKLLYYKYLYWKIRNKLSELNEMHSAETSLRKRNVHDRSKRK